MTTSESESRAKILYNYLKPYWAKPSKKTRDFIDDNFKDGLKSCMIKGTREQLHEAAVVLLLKWGNLYWTNYTTETLLRNAMCFTEKDVQMSDLDTDVVIIYHPKGIQSNSYIEEALRHNFTVRSLSRLTTIVLSEESLPRVEEVVSDSNYKVLSLADTPIKVSTRTKKAVKVSETEEDELGNVSEILEEKKTGRIKVCFKRGTKFGYLPSFMRDRIKVGKPLPEGVELKWE